VVTKVARDIFEGNWSLEWTLWMTACLVSLPPSPFKKKHTVVMFSVIVVLHDDAPAHFSYVARNCLETAYTEWWIGRQGPVSWPSRSTDRNLRDLFLWGHSNGCMLVYNIPGTFQSIHQSMHCQAEACVVVQGQRYEHLL
jgi:hypothetical protein